MAKIWNINNGYPYKNPWRKPPSERLLQNFRNIKITLNGYFVAKIWNVKKGVPHEVGL